MTEDREKERLISKFLSGTTIWIMVSFAVLVKVGKVSDFRKNMFLVGDMEILLGH